MTFWGYVGLLFFVGVMLEDYQHTKHALEMERIEASREYTEKR